MSGMLDCRLNVKREIQHPLESGIDESSFLNLCKFCFAR